MLYEQLDHWLITIDHTTPHTALNVKRQHKPTLIHIFFFFIACVGDEKARGCRKEFEVGETRYRVVTKRTQWRYKQCTLCVDEGKHVTHRDRNACVAMLIGLVCLLCNGKRLRPFCYSR